MSFSRSLLLAAVGLGISHAACICADDLEASAIQPSDMETLDGPEGQTTSNGLTVRAFNASKAALLEATDSPLTDSATVSPDMPISQGVYDTGILNSEKGRATFRYAMGCSLLEGFALNQTGTKPYEGGGVVSTTFGWLNGALAIGPKEELFACMAAHVNFYGFSVPLLIDGEHVPNDANNHSSFLRREAVWTAQVNPITSSIHFDVWPHPDFSAFCNEDAKPLMKDRLCAQVDGLCDFEVHTAGELLEDCVEGQDPAHPDRYTCNGQIAITTRLQEAGFPLLYPGCIEPQ